MRKRTNLLYKGLIVSILDSVSQMISIKTTQFGCSPAKPVLELMPTSMGVPNNIFMCAHAHMCVHSHAEPRGHFRMLFLVCTAIFFFFLAKPSISLLLAKKSSLAWLASPRDLPGPIVSALKF